MKLASALAFLVGSIAAASPLEAGEPPQSKPTTASAERQLTYKEKLRDSSRGFETVTCVFRADGLPATRRYSMVGQWMDGRSAEVGKEIRIDQSGRVLGSDGDEVAVMLAGMFPGEFVVFALVSEDGSEKVSVEITPFPIQNVGTGGCRLAVRPMDPSGAAFSITGQGFNPDQQVQATAVSSGERAEVRVDNKAGTLKVVLFPAVVGRSGGEASFTASDSECSATVNYKWGDQMRGSALTAEQRAALSQQTTVVSPESRGSVPAAPKPASSDTSGGWTALAQRGRTLLWKERKFAEAEPLLVQALDVVEKEAGPNDLNVGRLSYDLASLYTFLGRYSEAEPLFRRALAIVENALGPDNANVAKVLTNYAELMRKTKRPKEADQMEARARKIQGSAPR